MRINTVVKHDISKASTTVKAALAEFFGTLVMVLIITSVVAQNVLPKWGSANALIGVNVGLACATAFGTALSMHISGGHVNPAVTLAFLVLGAIKPVKAAIYIVAQIAGAFVGAFLTFLLYNDALNVFDAGVHRVEGKTATAHIFASYPAAHLGWMGGLFDQIVGTFVFVLIIVHTVDIRNRYPMWVRPFIMGLGFLMIGTAFTLNTFGSSSFNPARDFGGRLFTSVAGWGKKPFSFNNYGWFWIPIVGPFIGGVLAAFAYKLIFDLSTPLEENEDSTTHKVKPISEKTAILIHTEDSLEEHSAFSCFTDCD